MGSQQLRMRSNVQRFPGNADQNHPLAPVESRRESTALAHVMRTIWNRPVSIATPHRIERIAPLNAGYPYRHVTPFTNRVPGPSDGYKAGITPDRFVLRMHEYRRLLDGRKHTNVPPTLTGHSALRGPSHLIYQCVRPQ